MLVGRKNTPSSLLSYAETELFSSSSSSIFLAPLLFPLFVVVVLVPLPPPSPCSCALPCAPDCTADSTVLLVLRPLHPSSPASAQSLVWRRRDGDTPATEKEDDKETSSSSSSSPPLLPRSCWTDNVAVFAASLGQIAIAILCLLLHPPRSLFCEGLQTEKGVRRRRSTGASLFLLLFFEAVVAAVLLFFFSLHLLLADPLDRDWHQKKWWRMHSLSSRNKEGKKWRSRCRMLLLLLLLRRYLRTS